MNSFVSRRDVLKLGLAALVSGAALKLNMPLPPDCSSVQTTPKKIYIALDDHTDYMWSADESTYRQAFLDMLDYYLDLADATGNNLPQYQSRFNCDGSYWVWTYEKYKPAADFNRLISRMRDGHISMPLNPLILCPGGMPAEAVIRGMYYAGQLERRFNLRFPLVISMENQTLPYGLGALWAGSGARYSWKGICGCGTKVPDAWNREHEIYWYTGQDGSRVLMKWNSMLTGNKGMGGYAEARSPGGIVDYVGSDAGFIARYPYKVIGAFGKGWDDLKTLTSEFVSIAQAKSNTNRQVIVSNEVDFFQDFEANYGSSLPVVSESYGNEWDLYCASMAEVTARVRRSTEKLRGAESLATLVNLKVSSFMDSRNTARDIAWINLGLYYEHDWTANGPVGRSARRDWERRLAGEIESYVDTLQVDAVAALGGLVQKSGAYPRFFAFNPLGWIRTDAADLPYEDTSPFHVVDLSTGLETPSQIVTIDGQRRLRILAHNVPPVGYKVFEIRPGAGQVFSNAATVNGSEIESSYYRLNIAGRGAITGLVDKNRGNREFVRPINGRTVNDLGDGVGTVQVENAGPVSVSLLATSSSPLNHTSRVTLFRNSDRIEVKNDINQNFNAIYTWGYGFELNNPEVWHEEVGAIIKAKLLSQGGHYSPHNARYDWLTINHFADINGAGVGVTLSSEDCNFMQLGSSTSNSLDTSTPQISVLAGGQVDGPSLGIPGQGGDTHFLQRFALRTHGAFDPAAAMRFSLEHQNPLITGVVIGGKAYPETSFSLASIDHQDVLLWTLKPADDGISQGIIARVWNVSPNPASFSLTMTPGPILRAQTTTHIETPTGTAALVNGRLAESINPWQMKTFLVSLQDWKSYRFLPLIEAISTVSKSSINEASNPARIPATEAKTV
jgi:alpha-mannosidase